MSLPTFSEFITMSGITVALIGGCVLLFLLSIGIVEICYHRSKAKVRQRELELARKRRYARHKKIAKRMKELEERYS